MDEGIVYLNNRIGIINRAVVSKTHVTLMDFKDLAPNNGAGHWFYVPQTDFTHMLEKLRNGEKCSFKLSDCIIKASLLDDNVVRFDNNWNGCYDPVIDIIPIIELEKVKDFIELDL